ncbi:hypothetical protein SUDANB176_07216 [Streptomyces sp. enrichment culture]
MNGVRAKSALYVADVFASVPRRDRRAKGDRHLRGLVLDGRRNSVQAMAWRLPDGDEQNLQQFVNRSAWDPVPVQRRLFLPGEWVANPGSSTCFPAAER